MTLTIDTNATIQVVSEKRLRPGPSKGRNQWLVLKDCSAKSVQEFYEQAKSVSRSMPPDKFQTGSWWTRELMWNLERGHIRLIDGGSREQLAAVNEFVGESRDDAALTSDSGLYVVSLRNETPISAQADDPRHAERAIKVNHLNCKFGKAKSLSARQKNYEKTFGAHNVSFVPIARLRDIDRAETLILRQLRPYRARGPSGRVTEWLQRTTPDELIEITKRVLEEESIDHEFLHLQCGR